ncbi:Dabb family protein [Aspergillus saccharolyticus JOP 1030-1]|uniref:Stress-response A/B barrel domain-containing protein n=1 Tax=Aspergillus saccharolyticus JOP 1030-1 TaxID=1450539 RepID=A0A318Z784_9EURO|nr:hypothetical protein BP01DRAFT_385577 [Aspergillus saccharolyticus JOP 1030-1]PYH42257.1 hypothetical protein BP01DRAFT_385577 [Aspergillus saccharolyticus JOP 1030-1]
MVVIHIVLFQFQSGLATEVVDQACKSVLALKHRCIHPHTGNPYIVSFRGGKDHSPENKQHGISHGFVAEFESLADRDYYVSQDPVHLGLGKELDPLVEKVLVVDLTGDVV